MSDIIVTVIVALVVITLVAGVVGLIISHLPLILGIGAVLFVGWLLFGGRVEHERALDVSEKRVQKVMDVVYRQRDALQQEIHEEVESLTLQKPGVNLETLRPELDSAILVVVGAYHEFMGDDDFMPVITSGNDYEGHAACSAHYSGAAVDFRIKDIGSLQTRKALAKQVASALGSRFLVLHEDIGTANEHLHIQLKQGSYDRRVVWR